MLRAMFLLMALIKRLFLIYGECAGFSNLDAKMNVSSNHADDLLWIEGKSSVNSQICFDMWPNITLDNKKNSCEDSKEERS